MPPHALGSGTISFGLVSIPVKLYTAASAGGVSFNQLHAKCGNRLRQQMFCPVDNEVVDRSQIVKGYEFAKDQYVRFTDEEIKSLEGEASKLIDIAEFVPLSSVDPIYFEKTYYLGPDKGGEKPYRLLTDAMTKMERVALAKYVMRGKESLVLIRPSQHGLMLHTMYFADEVRDFGEVGKGESATLKEGELGLAARLIPTRRRRRPKPERNDEVHHPRGGEDRRPPGGADPLVCAGGIARAAARAPGPARMELPGPAAPQDDEGPAGCAHPHGAHPAHDGVAQETAAGRPGPVQPDDLRRSEERRVGKGGR